MFSLKEFKRMLGIESIELYQGKGRRFAKIADTEVFVGEETDLKKELFIIKGKYDAYWLVNSNAKVVATI